DLPAKRAAGIIATSRGSLLVAGLSHRRSHSADLRPHYEGTTMHACLHHRYALIGFKLLALVTFVAGCGQPVREDRSINWSKEGGSVGFQHGQEGVFLADKDGRKLTKIFQPGPDVLATSTPLWSPAGKRALFTTARSPNGQRPVSLPFVGDEQDPAGKVHLQQDI